MRAARFTGHETSQVEYHIRRQNTSIRRRDIEPPLNMLLREAAPRVTARYCRCCFAQARVMFYARFDKDDAVLADAAAYYLLLMLCHATFDII